MRRFIYTVSAVMAIILIMLIAMLIYVTHLADAELKRAYEYSEIQTTELVPLADLIHEPQEQTVFITNYYVNDSTGSGTVTSSGLTINDFQTNDLGWYVYKEKVVVATATYVCLEAATGACAKYKILPDGYSIFNLYDEITIIYDGKEYDGVVLDSMGAGFWKLDNEPYQRIDIFVAQTAKKFGKVVAQIKY